MNDFDCNACLRLLAIRLSYQFRKLLSVWFRGHQVWGHKTYVVKGSSTKQAEKLKSCEMKEGWMKDDEWRMMNEEWWWMNVEGWKFQAVEGFCDWLTYRQTGKQTNKQTFVNVESLLRLKNLYTYVQLQKKDFKWVSYNMQKKILLNNPFALQQF